MIWYDGGFCTPEDSLEFFREYWEDIGPIVGVTMLNDYRLDEWVRYPLRIIGDVAELWLSACNSGHGGRGPRGSVAVLQELGYPEPYCNWPLSKAEFKLGTPSKPVVSVEPSSGVELTEAHEEILDVIQAYDQEHGRRPTVREIAELAVLSTRHTVWRRLDELEAAGKIKRQPHKARSIEVI